MFTKSALNYQHSSRIFHETFEVSLCAVNHSKENICAHTFSATYEQVNVPQPLGVK